MSILGITGQPAGIDESGFWNAIDSTRPDALKWLAVSLTTGKVICELPQIVAGDPCRRALNQYQSMNVSLHVTPGMSPAWVSGTDPYRAALIAYRGAPREEVVHWGGIVLGRDRSAGSNEVKLTLATPECYLDSRYTGAYTTDPTVVGATRDQVQIVADLVNLFAVASSGLPITVVQLAASAYKQLAVYNDYDDKTVYSNLKSLNAYLNGPEFTADWVWNHTTDTITPVLYTGDRIGAAVRPGLAPSVTFDSANLIEGTLSEQYTSGMGANDVTAVGSGQGLARPSAPSVATAFGGRPRVQYRYNPATSIRDPLTLQQHSNQALALLQEGTNTITLKASATSGPQLGIRWNLGDDIGYVIEGPAFPDPLSGVGRCIGYESSDQYVTPSLFIPQVI